VKHQYIDDKVYQRKKIVLNLLEQRWLTTDYQEESIYADAKYHCYLDYSISIKLFSALFVQFL
jgi:hypothetical protein